MAAVFRDIRFRFYLGYLVPKSKEIRHVVISDKMGAPRKIFEKGGNLKLLKSD